MPRLRSLLRLILKWVLLGLGAFYGLCAVLLLLYNVVLPPYTGVQLQRQVEAWFEAEPYPYRYHPTSASNISNHLRHAVVAAEDARFYEHNGIDWKAVQKVVTEARQVGRVTRGGSTITQQLAKNLFLTTHSTWLRKGLEFPLTYLTELLLTKERILTLYVNVVEWDRGVFGAEAAAGHYFGTSAAALSRWQSAALASVLPAPRARSARSMPQYTATILGRMRQMGW